MRIKRFVVQGSVQTWPLLVVGQSQQKKMVYLVIGSAENHTSVDFRGG